jgi:signal transduction histidine kinase
MAFDFALARTTIEVGIFRFCQLFVLPDPAVAPIDTPSDPLSAQPALATKLAFLPRLAAEVELTRDRLEGLLIDLARVFGWARAGAIGVLTKPDGGLSVERGGKAIATPSLPLELAAGPSGGEAVVVADPTVPARRWIALAPAGGKRAYLWAEMNSPAAWAEADLILLRIVASLLASSMNAVFATASEDERIERRLHDAATAAGRMAHDLDNLWTGIIGFTDLTLPMLQAGSLPHQYVTEVATIGHRGTQMTQQLHQFSRSGTCRPMPTSIKALIERECARLSPPAEIQVPDRLPNVALDPRAFQSMLAQLIDNAREASVGVPLSVAAAAHELKNGAPQFHGKPLPGTYVEVSVIDRGPGVRADLRPRLLVEPFLTTKPRHRGLGLVTVHRIVRAHRGGIRIEDTPGGGTTVRVLLPVAAHPATGTADPLEAMNYDG